MVIVHCHSAAITAPQKIKPSDFNEAKLHTDNSSAPGGTEKQINHHDAVESVFPFINVLADKCNT